MRRMGAISRMGAARSRGPAPGRWRLEGIAMRNYGWVNDHQVRMIATVPVVGRVVAHVVVAPVVVVVEIRDANVEIAEALKAVGLGESIPDVSKDGKCAFVGLSGGAISRNKL